jgi:hypothetical protein
MSARRRIASRGSIDGSMVLNNCTVKSSGRSRKWLWYSAAVATKKSTWCSNSSQLDRLRISYCVAHTRIFRTGRFIGDPAMRRLADS